MAVLCAPSARTRLCVSSTREGAQSSRLFHIYTMHVVAYKTQHYIKHEHIPTVQCCSAGSFLITMLCWFHMSHHSVNALVGEREGPRWHQANESCVPLRWEDPYHRLQPYEWETAGIVGYGKSDFHTESFCSAQMAFSINVGGSVQCRCIKATGRLLPGSDQRSLFNTLLM